MRIHITNKNADIINEKLGRMWTFEFFIVEIYAKKYNKMKVYIKFNWFKPFIRKFIDEKWSNKIL